MGELRALAGILYVRALWGVLYVGDLGGILYVRDLGGILYVGVRRGWQNKRLTLWPEDKRGE